VTGVNQTALKLQEARAEQMGSDLVETTAHAGARPSHAEWQGKVFSLSGKSKKYPEFKSSTGYGTGAGLGGWNCRHSFFPYFEGSPRVYTNNELKGYNSNNVEYNGQKMTEYEASLQQRSIERNIRRWKREKKAMEAAGLPTEEASAKIKSWQEREKDFLNQTGLKRQTNRSQIGGYGKSEALKTSWENRKVIESRIASSRKDDIIKLAKANKIKGEVSLDYRITDTTGFKFDAEHINTERAHNVTREEAERFINNSAVALTRWKGQFICYVGSEGSTYVDVKNEIIKTAYKREQYDENMLAFIKGVEKI
ncbi:MAG TPA: hypothetical protein DDW34_02035, partial [Clostridium sp.]|nr:hypothetical protein [Clostridium sp.]